MPKRHATDQIYVATKIQSIVLSVEDTDQSLDY